jgi:hypothetical protein
VKHESHTRLGRTIPSRTMGRRWGEHGPHTSRPQQQQLCFSRSSARPLGLLKVLRSQSQDQDNNQKTEREREREGGEFCFVVLCCVVLTARCGRESTSDQSHCVAMTQEEQRGRSNHCPPTGASKWARAVAWGLYISGVLGAAVQVVYPKTKVGK